MFLGVETAGKKIITTLQDDGTYNWMMETDYGTTYYYMFESVTIRHPFATNRSLRDRISLNFNTIGNTIPTPNADGSITFGNGTLSAPSTTDLWNNK